MRNTGKRFRGARRKGEKGLIDFAMKHVTFYGCPDTGAYNVTHDLLYPCRM